MKTNHIDKQFGASGGITKLYPSLVMRTRNGAITTVQNRTRTILNAISIDQGEVAISTPKKKTLYQRHVGLNNREEREPMDVPKLQPLGDDKFWDF